MVKKAEKKHFYENWWFWAIIGIILIFLIQNYTTSNPEGASINAQKLAEARELAEVYCISNNKMTGFANVQTEALNDAYPTMNLENISYLNCNIDWDA
jgi:hypothetical protein